MYHRHNITTYSREAATHRQQRQEPTADSIQHARHNITPRTSCTSTGSNTAEPHHGKARHTAESRTPAKPNRVILLYVCSSLCVCCYYVSVLPGLYALLLNVSRFISVLFSNDQDGKQRTTARKPKQYRSEAGQNQNQLVYFLYISVLFS